jgi:transcriptional regulator NrdR family protein
MTDRVTLEVPRDLLSAIRMMLLSVKRDQEITLAEFKRDPVLSDLAMAIASRENWIANLQELVEQVEHHMADTKGE